MKPPVFIGDIHGNALSLQRVKQHYPCQRYFHIYSGDFIDDKFGIRSDTEIQYVLDYFITARYKGVVLHSNHMQVLYLWLRNYLERDKLLKFSNKGWEQTQRVVLSLHDDKKQTLFEAISDCKIAASVQYKDFKILASHAVPKPKFVNKGPEFAPGLSHLETIGSVRVSSPWWQDNKLLSKRERLSYNSAICGHYGFIKKMRDGGNIVCDLRGEQVPVYNYEEEKFKIY